MWHPVAFLLIVLTFAFSAPSLHRRWKLVTGVGHPTGPGAWKTGELKGCVLGNGGGWMTPPNTSNNQCPGDIYTTGGNRGLLGCPDDAALNKTRFPVTDPIDLWLCSNPCTPETPCLWDLDADPHERHEVSASNKDTVATLLARLKTLQRSFRNATTIPDNGRFCDVLKTRHVSGIGYFIGPWIGV